jgi:hypothetical protein
VRSNYLLAKPFLWRKVKLSERLVLLHTLEVLAMKTVIDMETFVANEILLELKQEFGSLENCPAGEFGRRYASGIEFLLAMED